MKKLIALFLAVLMLCSLCASAFAEMGYTRVKGLLSEMLESTFSISGFSAELDDSSDDKTVSVYFDFDDNSVVLFGVNSSNNPEGTLWYLDDATKSLALFVALCNQWDTFSGYMSTGYSFEILASKDDGDSFIMIDTAKKAAGAVDTFNSYFN